MAKSTITYGGVTAIRQMATNVKSLVNAVEGTAESAAQAAQTASTEAKWHGSSASIASNTAKLVTLTGFTLNDGARVVVTFKYANTAETATLNVNSTGAIDIKCFGTTSLANLWEAGESCLFVYDASGETPLWVLMKTPGSSVSYPIDVANGGTGATDAATARTNLGITPANIGAAASVHSHSNYLDATETRNANVIYAGPGSGSAAAPTFRALVEADIPSLSAGKITSGTFGVARGGTGLSTITAGSYMIGNGTNAVSLKTPAQVLSDIGAAASGHSHSNYYDSTASRTKNYVLAAPNGSNGAATFRALVAADIPSLDTGKLTSGTLGVARGGTGAASFTANSLVVSGSSTTGAFSVISNSSGALYSTGGKPAFGTLPIAQGGTGSTTAANALAALGGAKKVMYTATIPTSSWTSSGGGYYKDVTVSGILATDTPVVGAVLSDDVASAKLQGTAFASVNRIVTSANNIRCWAYTAAPTTAIPIQLLCIR